MQKLRILIYTDDVTINEEPGFTWSIEKLRRFVIQRLTGLIEVEIDFIDRHAVRGAKPRIELQGANRLTPQLVNDYHEIWIFGYRQVNKPETGPVGPFPDLDKAQPYNELDSYERAVLKRWMEKGGLMLTGDHSDADPNDPASGCGASHSTFITVGAALGRNIPRAGKLRDWDGPPSGCDGHEDRFNTLNDPEKITSEYDGFPQQLLNPSTPHKLFSYIDPNGQVAAITVLPDHIHEGKLLKLQQADLVGDDWPSGSSVPEVVATGSDKRPFSPPRNYPLVVAFDGDAARVGRIVADSSFHHYLNVNLEGVPRMDSQGKPEPGSELDQIAQYYANLALWLAPKSIRDQLQLDLLSRLAIHPAVLDARGASRDELGKLMRLVAEFEVGAANFFQLFAEPGTDGGTHHVDTLLSAALLANAAAAAGANATHGLAEKATVANSVAAGPPSQISLETLLGSVGQEFHKSLAAAGIDSPSNLETVPAAAEIIDKGLLRALQFPLD